MLISLQALALAAAAALDPVEAAEVAARLVGRPDIAPALVRVCERETSDGTVCRRVGVHQRDAWVSASSWGGQVQLGHLDPRCQPRGEGRRWATRGVAGLNAAAHWPYLPPCYQPEMLDVPIVSMLVAARKYLRRCDGERTRRWCPRVR